MNGGCSADERRDPLDPKREHLLAASGGVTKRRVANAQRRERLSGPHAHRSGDGVREQFKEFFNPLPPKSHRAAVEGRVRRRVQAPGVKRDCVPSERQWSHAKVGGEDLPHHRGRRLSIVPRFGWHSISGLGAERTPWVFPGFDENFHRTEGDARDSGPTVARCFSDEKHSGDPRIPRTEEQRQIVGCLRRGIRISEARGERRFDQRLHESLEAPDAIHAPIFNRAQLTVKLRGASC